MGHVYFTNRVNQARGFLDLPVRKLVSPGYNKFLSEVAEMANSYVKTVNPRRQKLLS